MSMAQQNHLSPTPKKAEHGGCQGSKKNKKHSVLLKNIGKSLAEDSVYVDAKIIKDFAWQCSKIKR
jgi:hypothetical protein